MADHAHDILAAAAFDVATQIPAETLLLLSSWIEETTSNGEAKVRVRGFPHVVYRDRVLSFLETCDCLVPPPTVASACLSLRTASFAVQQHRRAQSVELVWTGPESEAVPLRRTEQAVLEVIETAAKHVLLVCYAVYRIPSVQEAVVRAAARGVHITVILETPDRVEGKGEYSTLKALGPDVANCASVYFWPRDKRAQHANGKLGILHVKCVVADDRKLFLSSANMTEYAFNTNMELGVLITGGEPAKQVTVHFQRLLQNGAFEPI